MEINRGILQEEWLNTEDVIIKDTLENTVNSFIKNTGRRIKEVLDIYSEQITKSGKRLYQKSGQMEREEAHNIGALHTSAQIWIYNSRGDVLLQKRALTVKSSPGLFDTSVAGHIKAGETILLGSIREIWQEIGLFTIPENLIHIGNYRRETRKGVGTKIQHNNEIIKVFLLQYEGEIGMLKKQKKEVAELKFITLDQLEKDWNNPKTLLLYTSKGIQYRQMILSNLRKVLGRSK